MSSGLKIDISKSHLYRIGVYQGEVSNMAFVMHYTPGSLPLNHLGLQVGCNMNHIKIWKLVVDIFKKWLSIWESKSLSFGGKLTLIKSLMAWGAYHYIIFHYSKLLYMSFKSSRKFERTFLG